MLTWILFATLSLASAQNSPGMTQCQSTFIQNLQNCVQKSELEFNSFLHLVTNGTNGQASSNPEALKTQACGKQAELAKCGIGFMRQMMNSTMCQPSQSSPQDQRQMLDMQFRSLMGSLDEMCAHPCRRRLIEDLRKCYTSANLDPQLFLSNTTMARGAVIGTTREQAGNFCKNKNALVSCMKRTRDDCPESPMLLRAIGLDIDSLEMGVNVLCSHQEEYIKGIACFAEPTDAVISCQKTMGQQTVELMMKSQQQQLPENQFINNVCNIRLEHVSCDLDSWSKKTHKSCSETVIGLRTELECGLLPVECTSSHKQTIDLVCHRDNFKTELRPNGGTSFSVSSSALMVYILLTSGLL